MKPTKTNITALYDLESKTPAQIRALLKATCTAEINGKSVQVNTISRWETRHILAQVAAEKQQVINDTLKVKDFISKYNVWDTIGRPADKIVRSSDGILGFEMEVINALS